MTHRVIIIDDNSMLGGEDHDPNQPEARVSIPIPHGATPKQIGDLVEKTCRALDQVKGVV